MGTNAKSMKSECAAAALPTKREVPLYEQYGSTGGRGKAAHELPPLAAPSVPPEWRRWTNEDLYVNVSGGGEEIVLQFELRQDPTWAYAPAPVDVDGVCE